MVAKRDKMDVSVINVFTTVLVGLVLLRALQGIFNVYFHALSSFPGPTAAALTQWWKTYIEVYKQISMVDKLAELHETYGVLLSPSASSSASFALL